MPIAVIAAAILLTWHKKKPDSVYHKALSALRDIRAYRNHPLKVIGALLFAMLVTCCFTFTLFAATHAIGIHLSFVQLLLVLTAGVSGGVAVPTPGGLGGVEAGLFAGLVAFKASSAEALAAVLLYRLLTY